MKYLKMLGLAAAAAAALMASVGSSSASAGVLCKEKADPCAAASRVKNGEEFSSQVMATKAAFINTGVKNIECAKSTIAGKVTKEGGKGEVPEVALQALQFIECNCKVIVLKVGTFYVSHFVETFNGTPFGTGQEIETKCSTIFGEVECIYATNNTKLGELQGGNPAILEVNAKLPFQAGSNPLCEEGIWTGKYEVTKPKPVYVASN